MSVSHEFAADLLAWYDQAAVEMPWRGATNPYHIWLSEIMLQQTQIETVKPYFARFLSAYPNVNALAAARLDDV
ncbi:MAG: A/G-specific adenine glycosylase, partial [Anaerolineae bacterium]|nr:A/G-specific adenine glycosylase [Anaerolineae bacterium]